MRVGLCACYDNHNYGSMLQAFANEWAVLSLGHECEMIRYVKKYSLTQKIRQVPRVLNGGNVKKVKRRHQIKKLSMAYPEIARNRAIRSNSMREFCKKTFIRLSEPSIGFECLSSNSARYDVVMVGSDQLWLPVGLPTNFFNLQFVAPGVRRVSFATSFGVSSIPWYQKGRTADYLKKIDYLSVRESGGTQIVRDLAQREAKVVVDPTLLFSKDEWDGIVPSERLIDQPYIFCYFLGKNKRCRDQANLLSSETGLPIVVLRHLDQIIPEDESFGDYAPYNIDPFEFVNLVRHAEYVLTDSFHGSVFSIINHKQFQSFYRFKMSDVQSRNSRIDSLLSHLGLEGRLNFEQGCDVASIDAQIDWKCVDLFLKDWRSDSWDFLDHALGGL